jgi:hypothetical protein
MITEIEFTWHSNRALHIIIDFCSVLFILVAGWNSCVITGLNQK